MKTLILIRHGKNEENWGKGDAVGLSPIGEQQIRLSAKMIQGVRKLTGATLIINSGLTRSQQTSDILQTEFKSTSRIFTSVDERINSKTFDDWRGVYEDLFDRNHRRTQCNDTLDPDRVVIVTHEHNPFSRLFNVWIDFESAVTGTPLEQIPHQDVVPQILKSTHNRSHPLRKTYGGVSMFRITHARRLMGQQQTGKRIAAFCPYIHGVTPK